MIPRRRFLKGAAGLGVGTLFGLPVRYVAATDWRFFNELKKELKG